MAFLDLVLLRVVRLSAQQVNAGTAMTYPADNESPLQLSGYQILAKLGEGGMGAVYKAFDSKLQRTVAIKWLHPHTVSPTSGIGPLPGEALQEARKLARVNHANIVQIYELPKVGNRYAMVMEYLQGDTLSNAAKGQLTLREKLEYLQQICLGMQAVHQQGLLHGDLKPDNIFITHNNQVKILDFGIARELLAGDAQSNDAPRKPPNNQVMASRSNVSPEVLAGQEPAITSDVYAFGTLAFWLLTGKTPVIGQTTEEQNSNIRQGKLRKASTANPNLPSALSDFLQDLLATKAIKRPQDFAQVLAQLQQITKILFPNTVGDDSTVPLSALVAPTKRPKVNKAIVTFAGLILAIATTLVLWQIQRPEQATRFVLVLAPQMAPGSSVSAEQQEMVTAVIDNALRNAVLNTRKLNLIAKSEFIGVQAKPSQLAKITGASDILQTLLDCTPEHCQVQFERIDSRDNNVVQRLKWHTPINSAIELNQSTLFNFNKLFPDFASQYLSNVRISADNFEQYIQLYQALEFEAGDTQNKFTALKALILREPFIFPAYRIFRETALKLYLDSGDESYLLDLEQLLRSAPPEYRNSLFFTWDAYVLALYQQDLSTAKSLLDQAQQRNLDKTTVAELKGFFYLINNEPAKAKANYEFALTARFSTVNLFNLSLSQWYLGQGQQAAQSLEKLLAISPNDYAAKQQLATFQMLSGELESAIALYSDLVQTNPESRDLSNLSIALLLSNKLDEALIYARQSVSQSPGNSIWLLNLADIEQLSGNTTKAKNLYQQVLQMVNNRQDLDALLAKAQAHIHRGNAIEAMKALSQANKLSPNNGEVAFVSALVHTLQGEHASAIVKVEEALSLDMGAIWFTLPWFKPLCPNNNFKTLLNNVGASFTAFCQG